MGCFNSGSFSQIRSQMLRKGLVTTYSPIGLVATYRNSEIVNYIDCIIMTIMDICMCEEYKSNMITEMLEMFFIS